MTYKIKIYYRTGDSYNSNEYTDNLEFEWTNIDIAKDNLICTKNDGMKITFS